MLARRHSLINPVSIVGMSIWVILRIRSNAVPFDVQHPRDDPKVFRGERVVGQLHLQGSTRDTQSQDRWDTEPEDGVRTQPTPDWFIPSQMTHTLDRSTWEWCKVSVCKKVIPRRSPWDWVEKRGVVGLLDRINYSGGVNDNPWAKVSESDPQCPTAYLGALVRFLMTCICIHTSRGFKYGCLQPSGF